MVSLAGLAWLTPSAAGAQRGGVQQPAQPENPPAAGNPMDFGRMLVQGLKETEGCLGVETAEFASGKIAIIAWFKDVEAAKRWYNHPMHQRMVWMVGGDPSAREPLQHVEDPKTPVMVIAALTMGGEQTIPGPMPISQISIEMYTPLPGGAMVNGRLAPKEFPVPHFRSLGG